MNLSAESEDELAVMCTRSATGRKVKRHKDIYREGRRQLIGFCVIEGKTIGSVCEGFMKQRSSERDSDREAENTRC